VFLAASVGPRRELLTISDEAKFFGTDFGVWIAEKPYKTIHFWDFLSASAFSEEIIPDISPENGENFPKFPKF
jgi:hypothetical protein